MELNHHSHVQNGNVSRQSPKDSQGNLSGLLSNVMGENAPATAHSEGTDCGIIEYVSSLPTVFEDTTTLKHRKLSTREQLSNLHNLRKCGSSHDIRSEDTRPLSPFFSRQSSQESLDDNLLTRPKGMRMPNRKISSPLPPVNMMRTMCMRRRTLSESPAEALISPVVPRRCLSQRGLEIGVSRAVSCPSITSDPSECAIQLAPSPPVSPRYKYEDLSLNGAQPQTGTTFVTKPASPSSEFKSPEQDRLPRIHQKRCGSMLVRAHKTPTETARDLFNVSPVLGQSADKMTDGHNSENQCDVTDKVQYFLHTLSVEEGIDQQI